MTTTVLGATGFIGRRLAASLQARGEDCWLPGRDKRLFFTRPLGRVYYCIGLTADFRSRPYDTMDAHVGVLRQILQYADFSQLIYLSSTRVYAGLESAEEDQALRVDPQCPDDLYNLSKLMGESLALSSGRDCRVARLSNVLGPDMGPTNFVGSLLKEARRTGKVQIHTGLASEKDYIWIDDAVDGLLAIAERGQRPIYNLAGGRNLSHADIIEPLSARGIHVSVANSAPVICFPPIPIDNLVSDTGFRPAQVLPKYDAWLETYFSP